MDPALSFRGLRYRWPGQPADCLAIEQLSIAAGEQVFMVGASGSGKSTLLAPIAVVAKATWGEVKVLGTDVQRLAQTAGDRFRAEHIGIVFQQFNLLPWLSALDNVALACEMSPRRRQRAAAVSGTHRDEARRLLARLDLSPALFNQSASSLSVGQQQRVAAARALIGRPELIIADEPTSALDAPRQQAFIDLLLAETCAAGATLIFVSHDLRLANHFQRSVDLAALNTAYAAEQAAPCA